MRELKSYEFAPETEDSVSKRTLFCTGFSYLIMVIGKLFIAETGIFAARSSEMNYSNVSMIVSEQ